ASNNSSAVTIQSSNPVNATVQQIINSTNSHNFTIVSYADDPDGGADIINWSISVSAGSCSQIANATSGNRRFVNWSCSSSTPATASFTIYFNDSAGLSNNTSSSNAYPDNPASLTAPTISGTPRVGQTLTCNPGTFSDADGDTENTSARTWQWYNGTNPISGATSQTWVVPQGYLGASIRCQQTAVANTWTTSVASNNSSAVTIQSSNPVNATVQQIIN
ncbi:MAG: hypothetical protein N3D10_04385, partial [Candidatus Micrarchaeota archaeon]|nr:hypothetical protein [Candidatus Micrarchaeota archaeon]